MKTYTRVRVRLRRPCVKCDVMFIPTGRTNRICKDCAKEMQALRKHTKVLSNEK
jgi:hypothetical protein